MRTNCSRRINLGKQNCWTSLLTMFGEVRIQEGMLMQNIEINYGWDLKADSLKWRIGEEDSCFPWRKRTVFMGRMIKTDMKDRKIR